MACCKETVKRSRRYANGYVGFNSLFYVLGLHEAYVNLKKTLRGYRKYVVKAKHKISWPFFLYLLNFVQWNFAWSSVVKKTHNKLRVSTITMNLFHVGYKHFIEIIFFKHFCSQYMKLFLLILSLNIFMGPFKLSNRSDYFGVLFWYQWNQKMITIWFIWFASWVYVFIILVKINSP